MADAHALYQEPVIETEVPTQEVIEAYPGAQVGGSNPGTPEGNGAEGVFPVWDISKGLFLSGARNGLNNLSSLDML